MKKVSILLAVVVMVGLSVTGSAYGERNWWIGTEGFTGDWFYETGTPGQPGYATNWCVGNSAAGTMTEPPPPYTYTIPEFLVPDPDGPDPINTVMQWSTGALILIQPSTARNIAIAKPRIGYTSAANTSFPGGDCDILMTADIAFSASGYAPTGEPVGFGGIKLGWGRYQSENNPSTFTQTTGRVYVDFMDVAYTYGQTGWGDGEYILSGDALFQSCYRNNLGYRNGERDGRGLLRLEGDQVSFLCKGNGFKQNARSRTEFKMSATGGISTINLTNSTDAVGVDMAGTLELDEGTFGMPTAPTKLTAMQCAITGVSTLTFDISTLVLDAPAGWRMVETGSAAGGDSGIDLVYLPADANLDAVVNGDDYTLYAANYNTGTTWAEGDFNRDGVINGDDYTIYAANYGATPPPGTIPEPITLTLLGLGGLALLKRRRQ